MHGGNLRIRPDGERPGRLTVDGERTQPSKWSGSLPEHVFATLGTRIRRQMHVSLPDGSRRDLDDRATGADLAAAIGPGLARAALAVKVDGEGRDLTRELPDGAQVEIVTDRSPDSLDVVRHDAAHVLAAAVMDLYPGVKISIGPPIENGFYYDFEFPDGVTISDADFPAIEAKMAEHIAADEG